MDVEVEVQGQSFRLGLNAVLTVDRLCRSCESESSNLVHAGLPRRLEKTIDCSNCFLLFLSGRLELVLAGGLGEDLRSPLHCCSGVLRISPGRGANSSLAGRLSSHDTPAGRLEGSPLVRGQLGLVTRPST